MLKSISDMIGTKYIKYQIKRKEIPDFTSSKEVRYYVIFYGGVQGVGLRLEISELAKRLKLTGWIKNLKDSTVEAEFQGEKDIVNYLLDFMRTHKRIQIDNIDVNKIINKKDEISFEIVR